MCIYIYIYMYSIKVYIHILYIYIYIEREREKEHPRGRVGAPRGRRVGPDTNKSDERHLYNYTHIHNIITYTHKHIYTYITIHKTRKQMDIKRKACRPRWPLCRRYGPLPLEATARARAGRDARRNGRCSLKSGSWEQLFVVDGQTSRLPPHRCIWWTKIS